MIVYVPGATLAIRGVDTPEEPPPQPEIPVMSRSAPKQINAGMPPRFLFNGRKKRNPASATPNPAVENSEAVCVDSVKIESVKFTAVPPESVKVDGMKAHVALEGRPLHARLTLPE